MIHTSSVILTRDLKKFFRHSKTKKDRLFGLFAIKKSFNSLRNKYLFSYFTSRLKKKTLKPRKKTFTLWKIKRERSYYNFFFY